MNIHVLFGKRNDDDKAPAEALEVVDCFTFDESPEVLDDLKAKHVAAKQHSSIAWFKVMLPARAQSEIEMRLAGSPLLVASTIEAVS